MKAKTYLAASFAYMICFCLWAQTNDVPVDPTDPATGVGFLMGLIPVIVPTILAIGKFIIPKIPKIALPVAAPILGILIDLIDTKINGGTASPVFAAALGAAGVGIREIVDQIRKLIEPKPIA